MKMSALLQGTWRLVSYRAIMPDGSVRHPLGEDPVGRLTYDAEGRMAVQFMKRGRPLFASGEMRGGTPEEVKAAYNGYVAYYGTYSVDEAAGTVIHHVEASLFPNRVGKDQTRTYDLRGDRLTLTTTPTPAGGVMVTLVLVWEREKAGSGAG